MKQAVQQHLLQKKEKTVTHLASETRLPKHGMMRMRIEHGRICKGAIVVITFPFSDLSGSKRIQTMDSRERQKKINDL